MENVTGLMKRTWDKENERWIPAQINTVIKSVSKRAYAFFHMVLSPADYAPLLNPLENIKNSLLVVCNKMLLVRPTTVMNHAVGINS